MQLKYTVYQRRESHTDSSTGVISFYVSTVIGNIKDIDSGTPGGTLLPIDKDGAPLHNLFLVDYRSSGNPVPTTTKLYSNTDPKVLTPEDMGINPSNLGPGLPSADKLTRLYYETYTDLDPTDGAKPPVFDLDITAVDKQTPNGAPADTGVYTSNILVTKSSTLADADLKALEAIQQVTIFQRRYNELAAGFDTTADPALPSGYETFPIGS